MSISSTCPICQRLGTANFAGRWRPDLIFRSLNPPLIPRAERTSIAAQAVFFRYCLVPRARDGAAIWARRLPTGQNHQRHAHHRHQAYRQPEQHRLHRAADAGLTDHANGGPAVRIHVDDGRHLANGQPNKWKVLGGGAAMRRALIYSATDGRRAARGSQSVVLEDELRKRRGGRQGTTFSQAQPALSAIDQPHITLITFFTSFLKPSPPSQPRPSTQSTSPRGI